MYACVSGHGMAVNSGWDLNTKNMLVLAVSCVDEGGSRLILVLTKGPQQGQDPITEFPREPEEAPAIR